jgi:hypothetical protein
MAWGSSFIWPATPDVKPLDIAKLHKEAEQEVLEVTGLNSLGWDLGNGADKTVVVEIDKDKVSVVELYSSSNERFFANNYQGTFAPVKEYNNKVPTHDPYTNPNAHIYYECECGQILDPGTKRFAELNNCASNAGWKIRFSDTGYIPYCVDCGEGVE